jgi:glycosyltransferase involved in cell wall biosynthesis
MVLQGPTESVPQPAPNGTAAAAPDRRPRPPGAARGRLRVALLAGTLVQGGAEKQLVYLARALAEAGVDVRVYCLTRGEYYEGALAAQGIRPYWVGRSGNRLLRLLALTAALGRFRPHIVQSAHFFTNLYAAIPARLCRAVAIGCCRCDVFSEVAECNRLGPWSLRLSPALLVNSESARRNAQSLRVGAERIHVLTNVIDLAAFDRQAEMGGDTRGDSPPVAIALGRLVEQKRFDRFLAALARARLEVPGLRGLLVGDGPLRPALEQQARALGLLPDHLAFLGRRTDVPALLRQADLLVLSSDYEGFPNVVMEAMAARLPVLTTPAGDAASLVEDGVTGDVVRFEDVEGMATRLARLAGSPQLRRRLGEAGRRSVEERYGLHGLADRLLAVYRGIVRQQNRPDLLRLLPG